VAEQALIVEELKRALRERHLTYADVAGKLQLSLATVKRLFSTGDFSLQRVDAICDLMGVTLRELLERADERTQPANQLSLAQEQEIVADSRLLFVTWLLVNRIPFEDIVRMYNFTERELLKYFIRLDRLKVIELQPGNRARLLVSRRFTWRSGGPVQKYIHQKMLREFLSSPFAGANEEFFFHGGAISEKALGELRRALRNATRECVEIVEGDRGAWDSRNGAAFVLAVRPWKYSEFAQFDRK
jgi:transcriptional regulator with XRE-family HTH domain